MVLQLLLLQLLLLELLLELDVSLEPDMADAIYVGVSTDTGCFRYANTNAHTFAVAAECARSGARVYELNQELFETNTLGRLKMQAWIVDHMQLLRGGEMAICAIPKAVEEEIGDGKIRSTVSYTLICPEDYNTKVKPWSRRAMGHLFSLGI